MTAERFDEFARRLAEGTSRRSLLKGGLALAAGGVATRLRGDSAAARARVKMACARLGQACATGPGTPGDHICCPDLICGVDAVCCKDTNQTCVSNDDCCGDNTCRPNPSGLGNRCLPPGPIGAECIEDADCAGDLVCDVYTATCLEANGSPCIDDSDCVSGACDTYTGLCVSVCVLEIVYDSTVHPLPSNQESLSFQSTGTAEFGDHITLTGTQRVLDSAVVTLDTWAPHSLYPTAGDSTGWDHPITLNIYAVDTSGVNPAVGPLLGSVTQTFHVPWRAEPDLTCTPNTYWRAPNTMCYGGSAFNITFDMSASGVVLPDSFIYSVVFNTQNYGPAPIGVDGPYNGLNVALRDTTLFGTVPVGTDVEPDVLFWNTVVASYYTDGGTGGVGIFRRDTAWSPTTTAAQFTAIC